VARPRRGLLYLLACAGGLALFVFAYAGSLHNQLHFDDHSVLVENVHVRSLANVPRFFVDSTTYTTFPPNAVYRPVVSTSLALDHHLGGGLAPYAFRVSQLGQMALLWLALLAFYRVVMDRARPSPANGWLALFAATLFAVHTLNSEAMNLMHVRSEILSTLGLVAGFVVWLRGGLPRKLGLHYVAMVLGALAKLPAVTLGPLVMVWTFLEARAAEPTLSWGAAARRAARAGAGLLVAGVVVALAVSRMDAPTQHYAGGDRLPYALTQVWAWLHYLRLALLPLGLSADPDSARIERWYDSRVFAGALALAALAWLFAGTARSRRAWPIAFGLAWWAIGLAPASSIIPISETMNDHRPFVGLIGLILAAVWGARSGVEAAAGRRGAGEAPAGPESGRGGPRAQASCAPTRDGAGFATGKSLFPGPGLRVGAVAVCLAILGAHVAGTRVRNEVWREDLTLWTDVTAKSPGNGRGWMNYGLALMQRGRLDEAAAAYDRAAALLPHYYVLRVNQAILAGARGQGEEAERLFREAIALGPTMPDPYYYYARWLVGQGRGPEALAQLAEARRVTPGYAAAADLAMELEVARGDWAAAAALATARLAIDPADSRAAAYARRSTGLQGDYELLLRLGMTLGQQRDYVGSAVAYRAALQRQPTSAEALNNLGWTLGQLGFYPEAAAVLEQALVEQPDFELARNNLAWVATKLLPANR
jgi:tetratricopeptide (TPR) repeat protein